MSEKKTVLITGCSAGGIGFALAKEFHSRGYRVFATSRRLDSMDALPPLGIETLELDVTDIDAIRKIKAEISTRTGGKLDILVNNAGQSITGAASDTDMADVRAMYELNLFAPMCIVQEFLPLLISAGKACVVNTGSVAAVVPTPFLSYYNASKAALRSFGNTLRIELAPFNIRIVDLMTGQVKSNVMKPYTIPDGSLYKSVEAGYQATVQTRNNDMPAEEFARIVVTEVAKANPRRTVWAGTSAAFAWFIYAFLPSSFMDMILGNMFGFSKLAAQVRNAEDKKHV
ncbi:NAD-P-binding protein [Mycena galopus ATCC 62051]|nr:NAD-P-binding protein [Mycena galopus ATCC 62051]